MPILMTTSTNSDFDLFSAKMLESEKGYIIKKNPLRLKIALIYPNVYKVGMSNLGLHKVYKSFNDENGILCERFFLPSDKQIEFLLKKDRPLRSMEGKNPLNSFDLIAFSITSELDYINIPIIMKLGRVPLRNRSSKDPILIAGGIAVTMNPEPIADFFDAIFIGEGGFDQLIDGLLEKDIKALENLENIYIPANYSFEYQNDKILSIKHKDEPSKKVKRSYDISIIENPAESVIYAPESVFGDMKLIEIGKGCGVRCRFCASSFSYSPTRFSKKEVILKLVEKSKGAYDKIGLIGSAVGDHPEKTDLMKFIVDKNFKLSVSSLMLDKISSVDLDILQKGQSYSITAAIETGSQTLRTALNKRLSDDQIIRSVDMIAKRNFFNLKLYFLIGFPNESFEDINDTINLIKEIAKIFNQHRSRKAGKQTKLTISIDSFVPKAFTPLQWAGFEEISSLKEKFKLIKESLKKTDNLQLMTGSPKESKIEALLSTGNRKLSELVEQLSSVKYDKAKYRSDISLPESLLKKKEIDSILPYSFIDTGLHSNQLKSEYILFKKGRSSFICEETDHTQCKKCGIFQGVCC